MFTPPYRRCVYLPLSVRCCSLRMKDWLRDDDVLFLKGSPRCDPDQLYRVLEPLGFKAFISTRSGLAENEIKRLLLEKGISYVWRLIYQEAVLPRTADLPGLLRVVQGMLTRIAPTQELIIVDRYLLPRSCPDSLDNLTSILEPVTGSVGRVVLVTSKRCDDHLVCELGDRLRAADPTCEVSHRVSESFHDRFWIADRDRGLFVGTSPNGLGVRYALADYMNASDVREIVDALNEQGLL